jgi:hypothetical protein
MNQVHKTIGGSMRFNKLIAFTVFAVCGAFAFPALSGAEAKPKCKVNDYRTIYNYYDKTYKKKTEYETSDNYNMRIAGKQLSYTFTYKAHKMDYMLETCYDIDSKTLKLQLDFSPIHNKSKRDFILTIESGRTTLGHAVGQNAFGVRADITRLRLHDYNLNIINHKSVAKVLDRGAECWRHNKDLSNSHCCYSDYIGLQIEPNEAKALKNNLGLAVTVTPIAAGDPLIYTSSEQSYSAATLDAPTSATYCHYNLNVILEEITIYNKSTGVIIFRAPITNEE